MTCRVLKVSRAGYYAWRDRVPSPRAVADEALTATIRQVHLQSRGTYGAPRVQAEFRLGLGVRVGRKRVASLMRLARLQGVCHRRKRRGWKPAPAPHEDLVKRVFRSDRPDRLWFSDITQHRAKDGWVYCAAVIDAYSRRVVGWSISDRITSEIVVDALEMARWQRRPQPGTIVHADRGAQYTSWVFGHRLHQAGLLGTIGKRAPNSPPRCSSGSRRSTTLATDTPGWAMSAPPTTKHSTTVSQLRHDHHTNRVHQSGAGSGQSNRGSRCRYCE